VCILQDIHSLLKRPPSPDPRTWLNKKAAELYFNGGQEEREEYKRTVRRFAQRSMEEEGASLKFTVYTAQMIARQCNAQFSLSRIVLMCIFGVFFRISYLPSFDLLFSPHVGGSVQSICLHVHIMFAYVCITDPRLFYRSVVKVKHHISSLRLAELLAQACSVALEL